MTHKKKNMIWLSVLVIMSLISFYPLGLVKSWTEIDKQKTVMKVSQSTETVDKQKNWIILVTLNYGYFDFFLNWYLSFKRLDIHVPVTVVAEDMKSYLVLKNHQSKSLHVHQSAVRAVSHAVKFGSYEYSKLASMRATHILKYLTIGENVLFADIDAVWLKNPFEYFVGDFDMWLSYGGPYHYCACLLAIKSNDRTLNLIRKWEEILQVRPQKNQYAFNQLEIPKYLRIGFLQREQFPTGRMLFFNRTISLTTKQRSAIVIFHNNCVVGYDKKLERFKELDLWYLHSGLKLNSIFT